MDFDSAVLICRKFEHPNLLKLYGLCTRQGALFVVTELLQQQGTKSHVDTLYNNEGLTTGMD